MPKQLVDANGNPFLNSTGEQIRQLRQNLHYTKRELIKAKFDAAQTVDSNSRHWANADNLDPHAVASLGVRAKLRSRSRYELQENNPYLKGSCLMVANDFVGSGPKLQITDKRISKQAKQVIEDQWNKYARSIRLRQKLWRMRLAKIVDGEAFAIAFDNPKTDHPVKLDFKIVEADRISNNQLFPQTSKEMFEVDGVRFDVNDQVLAYYLLRTHPGSQHVFNFLSIQNDGDWIPAERVIHWYRQDRGWVRGIPELSSSLPLCALLRRYTLAMVRHAETAADLTAIITSDGPAGTDAWTVGGELVEDEPFDTFPLSAGMMMNLPWKYDIKQLDAVPLGLQYDEFVGSLLREIMRPIHVTYGKAIGSSKDSNMASAVIDQHQYKEAQQTERYDCDEVVVDKAFKLWWPQAVLTPGYINRSFLTGNSRLRSEIPDHTWRWDQIGKDHSDPQKVAAAITTLRQDYDMTDRDIQERYFNRDVEQWRAEVQEDHEFRMSLKQTEMDMDTAQQQQVLDVSKNEEQSSEDDGNNDSETSNQSE